MFLFLKILTGSKNEPVGGYLGKFKNLGFVILCALMLLLCISGACRIRSDQPLQVSPPQKPYQKENKKNGQIILIIFDFGTFYILRNTNYKNSYFKNGQNIGVMTKYLGSCTVYSIHPLCLFLLTRCLFLTKIGNFVPKMPFFDKNRKFFCLFF